MISHHFPGGVELRFSERADGDLAGPAPALGAFAGEGWSRVSWLDQRHTDRFVWVDERSPGRQNDAPRADAPVAGVPVADALGSAARGHALVVRVADCAPIAIFGASAGAAAVHAGWRGLRDGVIARAVQELRRLDAELAAHIGPCIHKECYEFGAPELDELAQRFGSAVRAVTAAGAPSFDLVAAAVGALEAAGVSQITIDEACTSCDAARFFSHRARHEPQRHALAVWRR